MQVTKLLRRMTTLSELPLLFEHYLKLVMEGNPMPTDTGLDWATVKALKVIAAQGGNAQPSQIAAAKAAFNASLEIGRSR